MVTTAGLLDSKVKGSKRILLVAVLAVAIKTWVFPTSIETSGPGVSATTAGTGLLTTLVVELVPQPAKKMQPRIILMMLIRPMQDANLPMNPSTKEWMRLFWKTLSVEADHYLSNLVR
jgi:hypothetical protein